MTKEYIEARLEQIREQIKLSRAAEDQLVNGGRRNLTDTDWNFIFSLQNGRYILICEMETLYKELYKLEEWS